MVKQLIENGFDVNAISTDGDTALIWAAERGRRITIFFTVAIDIVMKSTPKIMLCRLLYSFARIFRN